MVAHRPARASRRGFGLFELTTAGVLFGALVLLTLHVVAWVAAGRQAAGRREAAIRTVGNLMERALARPWAEVDPARLAPLAEEANHDRPASAGRVAITVDRAEPVGAIGRKRVVVEVAWPDPARFPESPVRLVAWTSERKERP